MNTRHVLGALYVYGPCANAELAHKLGIPAEECYRLVYQLRRRGLADRTSRRAYRVTDHGADIVRAWKTTEQRLFQEG